MGLDWTKARRFKEVPVSAKNEGEHRDNDAAARWLKYKEWELRETKASTRKSKKKKKL